MKKTLTSLIVATMTLPTLALALASEPVKQQVDLNKFKDIPQNVKAFEQNPEIKKLLDSKTLEQNFLNGVKKLRLGTNSGGGGDEVGLDFQRTLQSALEGLRNHSSKTFSSLEKQGIAAVVDQAKIIVLDEDLEASIKGYTQNSVAVNLPEMKTILVNRQRWNNVLDSKIKEGIALHEVLSLMKLESTGNYAISSKYVTAKGGTTKEMTSSLQVNRLQQIRSLDKTMSDGEILKRFFDEASEPISLDDFKDVESFTPDMTITDVACAYAQYSGVVEGKITISNAVASPDKYLWVKQLVAVKDAVPDSGRPELGPLLPEVKALGAPEQVEYRIGLIRLSNGKIPFPIAARGLPEIQFNDHEITQTRKGYSLEVSQQYRKNNGLIVEKSLGESTEIYKYCYPTRQ